MLRPNPSYLEGSGLPFPDRCRENATPCREKGKEGVRGPGQALKLPFFVSLFCFFVSSLGKEGKGKVPFPGEREDELWRRRTTCA